MMTGNVLTAQTIPASGKSVTATIGNMSSTAIVNVTVGPLNRLAITPTDVTLAVHATQQFTAGGFDVYGNAILGLSLVWQVAPVNLGEIDATGLFTAGIRAGEYPNAVVIASGPISATAKVVVYWPYQVYLPVVLR